MRRRWSATTKAVIAVFLALIAGLVLYRFRIVIVPLILAAILAYIISPLVSFLARRTRLSWRVSVAVVYALLIAVIVALPSVLVPVLLDQVDRFALELQQIAASLSRISRSVIIVGGLRLDVPAVLDRATRALEGLAEPFAVQTLSIVLNVVEFFTWAILILITSFYLVKDGGRLKAWAEGLAPPEYRDDFRELGARIGAIWAAFFRGQIVLALVVMVLIGSVSALIGLRFALALGVAAGLLEFLPSLGHGIWLVIAVLVALLEGSTWLPLPNWAFALIVVGLHVVFQQTDLNYLIPRIIGRRVRLHPMVVILGIVGGALLAGVLGVALAAPTLASARVLGQYLHAGLFDLNPFPPEAEDERPAAERAG